MNVYTRSSILVVICLVAMNACKQEAVSRGLTKGDSRDLSSVQRQVLDAMPENQRKAILRLISTDGLGRNTLDSSARWLNDSDIAVFLHETKFGGQVRILAYDKNGHASYCPTYNWANAAIIEGW